MPMMIVAIILGHFVIKDCWGEPYTYMDGGTRRLLLIVSSVYYMLYFDILITGN